MDFVEFSKEKAEYFLDCLANGKPITPVDEKGWTRRDAMALAGACWFVALTYGRQGLKDAPGEAWPKIGGIYPEHPEASEDAWQNDLAAAVELYAALSHMVHDGRYDQQHDPETMMAVEVEGEYQARWKFIPIKGFKECDEQSSPLRYAQP